MRFNQHRRSPSGFTLIEIVIVLSVLSLLIGMTVLRINSVSGERQLRGGAEALKDFAKQARMFAIVEQRPHQVLLTPGSIRLQASGQVFTEDYIDQHGVLNENIPAIKRYDIDADLKMSIRRWRDKEFRPIKIDSWVFEHTGICEPLSIRFERLSDGSYLEITFNALTANVEREDAQFN
ncbi:MAG: prepilin-type N-terminal cleavage/methylation domain-containing protein [Verrucomicrobiales bacterium]|nr:prepilin-type N-terminal cleavage/methylation domain-containing protein [Verrucomicrobiae bacterium]